MEEERTVRRSGGKLLVFFLVVVIVGVIVWQVAIAPLFTASGEPDAGLYQAVFLTNNQVYFGKLNNIAAQYPVLRDIYYLQVTQTLQPRDATAPAQPTLNLIKLGAELHGPTDEMRINRDHILFWENLKPDSQVVQAIVANKEASQ
jgi:hypothetical protein